MKKKNKPLDNSETSDQSENDGDSPESRGSESGDDSYSLRSLDEKFNNYADNLSSCSDHG